MSVDVDIFGKKKETRSKPTARNDNSEISLRTPLLTLVPTPENQVLSRHLKLKPSEYSIQALLWAFDTLLVSYYGRMFPLGPSKTALRLFQSGNQTVVYDGPLRGMLNT